MARQWEMGMGYEYGGMGMGTGGSFSGAYNPTTTTTTTTTTTSSMAKTSNFYGMPSTHDTFRMDDLLDFSNNDLFVSSSAAANVTDDHLFPLPEQSIDSSSKLQSFHHSFADDIYIPSEEAAELEWLSKFVDDSYADIPTANLVAPPTDTGHLHADNSSVPIRVARGGRRNSLSSSPSSTTTSSTSSSSDFSSSKMTKSNSKGSKGKNGNGNGGEEGAVRRCTHCASEKTPQWRTGPLGPKTLCNACGVRYKSGRLMPEYRPAASPTFVLTQHSNSHRKVMELRRQKEIVILRHQNDSSSSAAAAASDLLFHDYGVC